MSRNTAPIADGLHGRVVTTIKAALAEAGYPDAAIAMRDGRPVYVPGTVPPEAAWRAAAFVAPLFDRMAACFPCWRDHRSHACDHDTWDNAPPVVRPAVTP